MAAPSTNQMRSYDNVLEIARMCRECKVDTELYESIAGASPDEQPKIIADCSKRLAELAGKVEVCCAIDIPMIDSAIKVKGSWLNRVFPCYITLHKQPEDIPTISPEYQTWMIRAKEVNCYILNGSQLFRVKMTETSDQVLIVPNPPWPKIWRLVGERIEDFLNSWNDSFVPLYSVHFNTVPIPKR